MAFYSKVTARVVLGARNPEISKPRRELSSPVLAAVAADQRSKLQVGSGRDNDLVPGRADNSPDNAVRVELRGQRLRSAPDVFARNCIHLLRAMKVLRESGGFRRMNLLR